MFDRHVLRGLPRDRRQSLVAVAATARLVSEAGSKRAIMIEQLDAPFGNEFANRQLACAPPYFSVRHMLAPVHTSDLSEAGLITCIQFGAVRCSHGPGLRAVHEDRKHKCIVEADLCCKG